jgi:hypothetical protein
MTSKSLLSKAGLVACLAIFVLLSSLGFGQQLTGTLAGTTTDSTGAVVANAKITMKNEASGDVRTTVSNATGYFSITAIQPGTYTVTVEAPGFKMWKQAGIAFAQGDNRNLPQIALQVGAVNETVEITAGALTVPTDNAEISTTVPEHMVDSFPMGNRDAGELLKIMPGMAFANGNNQGSGWSEKVVSSASGPVGAFSSNGTQPSGAMAFMLDGANLVDPGNAGSQVANINQDMVSEVKVLMSDYSAEYAKGPVVFQAFSKSGGAKYHGEGYMYARNSALNAIDAYTHSQIVSGATTAAIAAPAESYYYMGGNFGGPVPGLNKGRQKLFFWGGYEYMRQHPAGSIVNFNIPTTEQRAGDFSNTTFDGVKGTYVVNQATGETLATALGNQWGYAYSGAYQHIPNGASSSNIPPADFDPNADIYLAMLPKPNIMPNAGNSWSNYQFVTTTPQNRWEATGKVDYAIGDNTKLTGSYSRQIETDQHPIGIWWTPPWTLPYPSGVAENLNSQLVMTNFTHVFSPSTTNEAVFTFARFNAPNILTNEKLVDRTALGMNITGLFGVTTKQIPNIQGPWGGTFPDIAEMNLTGPFDGNGFGAEKKDPSIYDNYTKVIGSHTIKLGAYWDTNENIQSSSAFGSGANGSFNMSTWGATTTGNTVMDFLLGDMGSYSQPSADIVNTIQDHQWSIYAQDSYKANRQLTLNYGLRFDHVGQWYGASHGMAVWDWSSYVNGTYPNNLITTANTGQLWHGMNSSIPVSGWSSPLFYYEPRVGFAYDIFGNGKTVLRGGYAAFRYQVSVNDVTASNNLASGIYTATLNNVVGYANISNRSLYPLPPPGESNGGSISLMQRGDNRTPHTNDWNISVAQALPWRSVFEVSYVGNQSKDMLINGGNGKLDDLNSNFPGAYWLPDPTTTIQPNGTPVFVSPSNLACGNTGESAGQNYVNCAQNGPNNEPLSVNYGATPYANQGTNANKVAFNENNYRRLTNYQDIYLITHGSYANYNSVQASWKKQSGPINTIFNYSFSKVMGIRDGNTDQAGTTGTVVDPFNLKDNYGPLAYDHTQILNLTYIWNMPKFVHGSRWLEGTVNGWQLSGYTTYQSGAPLQANGTLNFTFAGGLTFPVAGLAGASQLPDNTILMPDGLKSTGVNQGTFYGTSQTGGGYSGMLPLITCDPRSGRTGGQYFNPNCFTTPDFGQLGTFEWPYIHGPAYFDTDLGLYKAFKISESKQLQLRISTTNLLNHPLYQFGLAGTADDTINLQQNTTVTIPVSAMVNLPANPGNDSNWPCDYIGGNNIGSNPATVTSCNYTEHAIAPTNTSPSMTGKPGFKTGQRVVTFAAKFYF